MNKLFLLLAIMSGIAFGVDKKISSSGDLTLSTAVSKKVNLNNTLYTTQDGKVGVGTDTPGASLAIKQASDAITGGLLLTQSGGATQNGGMYIDSSGYLNLRQSGTNAITLNAGKVGIGISPGTNSLLHVNGKLTVGADSSAAYLIELNDASSSQTAAMMIKNTYNAANTGTRLDFVSSGGFGRIQENSGSNTSLGGAYTFNVLNNSGGVYLTQGATSWGSISDMREKKVTKYFDNALEKIKNWKVFSYTMPSQNNKYTHFGMSAQDVLATVPEIVTGSLDTRLGLNYDRISCVLVKAIQEQQAIIEKQKTDISLMKNWICKQNDAPGELCSN